MDLLKLVLTYEKAADFATTDFTNRQVNFYMHGSGVLVHLVKTFNSVHERT